LTLFLNPLKIKSFGIFATYYLKLLRYSIQLDVK